VIIALGDIPDIDRARREAEGRAGTVSEMVTESHD